MAPLKRARVDQDNGDVIAVDSASFSLRHDGTRKKARLSPNQNISKSQNAQNRSVSPPSSDDSSNDSDDDLPDVIDNGGDELPPSTQYETMRDGNFEHLANEKEDDERARRKFLARNRQIGENRANDNAIIEEITCVNFMCHEKLIVPLGPLINFVVGMNGSGKSAVLTAITLCLGGKAAATNRGSSLKSLIKGGEDQAVLIIKLKNQGNDAYQPDVYGKTIIIERHFSRTGSSSFKLKSATGRLISNKKGDVDDIVEYYQLQVDNPMNVLTQDAAKSFITASTPAQKYKFFVEGVQLETLNNDYKIVMDFCDQIEAKLEESRGDIQDLKKKSDDAQEKYALVTQRKGMRQELRKQRLKLAWSTIMDEEAKLAEAERKVSDTQLQIDKSLAAADAKDTAFQKIDENLVSVTEALASLEEELPPLQADEEAARNAHEAAAKEVAVLHAQSKLIANELKAANAKVESIKTDIGKEERRLQDADGGAHSQKVNDLAEARQSASDAKAALERSENERPRLEENQRNAIISMKNLESPLKNKTEELNSAKARLQSLNTNHGDPLAGYERNMANLLKVIQEDRGFREKPVGPMGLHVKLLESKWSDVLESTLNSALNGFIVTNKLDQMRLSELLRRHKMTYCSVSIGSSAPLDTTGHEPDNQYETIYRALTIDNESVKRQLIIGNSIEQIILVAKRTEAMKIMYDGHRPSNVKTCFALHDKERSWGHRVGFGGRGGREVAPIPPPRGKQPRMKIDHASQISYQRETVDQLERERNRLTEDFQRARDEINTCKTRLQQHMKDQRNLKITSQKAERIVEDIQHEIENLRGDDGSLDDLKRELAEAEQSVVICAESYGNAGLEKDKLNGVSAEKKRALDATKLALAEYGAKLKKAQDKVSRISQARRSALTDKNVAIENTESLRQEMADLESARDEQAHALETLIPDAEAVGPRVSLDPGDTTKSLDTICHTLFRRLKEYERQQGGSDDEINRLAAEALAIYNSAKSSRAELTELSSLLKKSFVARLEQFRRFQQSISARSRINFNYLLTERAFRGKLTIDHRHKLLDVQVEPDETTKSSKGRQTKTLSGGEKSFSSICLLLSLWEAMGAPLRCLDEFDVFMDDVNRDVSTKMIISAARRAVGRQFILITPKALGAGLDADADVNVIKLKDPRDKQRRIDEML